MTEREQILGAWNATEVDVPRTSVVELFLQQVAAGPDRIAVVCDGEALTFAELAERSARMASALVQAGVRRETRVGVYLGRSLDLVATLLAVLRSGGSYVPLDVAQPEARIAQILSEARPAVVVTERGRAVPLDGTVILPGDAWREARAGAHDLPCEPAAIAYVMFTSGSTGTPKGVEVSHGALVNFLWSMRERPGFADGDTLVAVTTVSFDISGLELYLPLVSGGRVVVGTGRIAADGVRLAQLLDASGATVLQATPATWRMLFAAGWSGRRELRVLCGGEALPPDLARSLRDASRGVWNLYGPTETTIWSTLDEVGDDDRISIGRPIANTRCYVLDHGLELLPPGADGELFIAGRGLARGYLHRPGLTAERFVPDPFRPGERMYRTGDVARWLPDGRLEHLGRSDHQVKIRGFRIELGEIEASLAAHPAVGHAVVVARDFRPDDRRLVAYLTTRAAVTAGELARHVAERLPAYMVPSAFVMLDAFPLTPNGKIDRRRLPAPAEEAPVEAAHAPPASPLEAELMAIWSAVLGLGAFDREAEFADLGGHSLLATQVLSRVNASLGIQLPIDVMFDAPTVPKLARAVEQARHATGDGLVIAPHHAGEGATVQVQRYFFALDERQPAASFGAEHVAWRIEGALDVRALAAALQLTAERHEILRTGLERRGRQVVQRVHAGSIVSALEVERVAPDELGVRARTFLDRPYQLGRGEVVRAKLIQTAGDTHVLVVGMHHVAFDYASWYIYADEVAAAYRLLRAGAAADQVARTLGELPFQFLDVAAQLADHADAPAGARMLDAWHRKMDGVPALALPADHPRDAVDAARAAARASGPTGTHVDEYLATLPAGVVTVKTDDAFAREALAFLARERATPLSFLLAGLATLVHRETGQTDLAFNTNVGTRPLLGADRLIGPFHSPTFVRVRLDHRPSYRRLLAELRGEVLDMLRYALVPVLERVEHPVGRLGFGFFGLDVPQPLLRLDGARSTLLPSWSWRMDTHFDLWPMLDLRASGLTIHLIYSERLFRRATIERLAASYVAILRAIVAEPEQRAG